MYAPDTPRRNAPHRQRGLSMIEVMVGMVVALLVGLAAAGTAISFSASQRQGIGSAGSMLNASTALAAIRDDVASAGLGFFGDRQYLCNTLNFSIGDVALTNGTDFVPLRLASGGSEIDVVWGLQVASGANVLLAKATSGATSAEVRSLLPVSAGQAVLMAPPSTGMPCLVRTVTEVTASTDETSQTLSFGNVGKYNKVAFSTMPDFPVNDYPDIGRVALLGDIHWSRYMLTGTTLQLQRPMDGTTVDLVNNVLAFRAEYGISSDAPGSTALESWTPATGDFATLTPTTLKRVRAVRVGMVTRSPLPEKADSSGTCRASSSKPTDPFDPSIEITPDVTDWQCYRYRTAVVVVPLRNLVIGMKP
jgi:type IV pilus assembly protein PilW